MSTQNNQDTANAGTITVTGKPSTSQAAKYYEYKNYTKTWRNWCPLCGRSGKLSDNPKGVAEGEITCDKSKGGCDADYDICTGGDKSGSYRAYLQDANGRSNTKDNVDVTIGGAEGGAPQQTTTATGGSAVQIPDLTFYGLIKQMMGATDSIFITANNMAYLLSYKDLHKYKDEYEKYIPEIKASHIIKDSIVQYWTTEGLYNTVEVTYKDGTIRYQHDLLVEQYGQQTKYYEFEEDDEETAKAKAQSLLSAHVRDYSLDLQFNCIYNPHITVGTWVKVPKTIIKTEKKEHEEKKPAKAKRKGVNISNITEKTETAKNGKTIKIEKITTEDKETVEVKTEQTDYEIYYVQGYKYWWTPDHPPIMNIHLKYGPDTPEDPINATIGVGGVSSGGGFGDDCFWICAIMPNNCAKIGPHDGAPDLHKAGFEPTEEHKRARCKAGSNLANNVAGMTPEEAFGHVVSRFGYCRYADSSALWPCVSDMYDQAEGCGLNCADHTRVMKCVFDAIGIPCWGVHVVGHYYNAIELNGEWRCVDATSSYSWSNIQEWPRPSHPASCCLPGQQSKTMHS